jgi:Fe-S cluster biogenesis protein NfuA/nitrite reductase/ring-hydroxylating ferredoxin subunit
MDGDRRDPERLVERVQELSARLEASSDPLAREAAGELVSAIMDMYGEGLERIVAALDDAGPEAEPLRERLAADGVVASLLLIHGLYPVDLETRVLGALEEVRPYMHSHGGDVELVSLEDGVLALRLQGSCHGCPASTATLESAIRTALEDAAPDLLEVRVEGLAPAPTAHQPAPAWHGLDGVGALPSGSLHQVAVSGVPLVVANVGGTLLAYRDECPGCGGALGAGSLEAGVLSCPGCRERYVLPSEGRALDGRGLQLEPVPLRAEDGEGVRVALAT